MRSQNQWVVMYGLRQQIAVVPTRFFKWDSPREWALKFQTHFSAKLGLGFEDAPAVSYDSFELKYEDKAVPLHMRSGHTIVEDFEFLEQYVPMAGSYCGE